MRPSRDTRPVWLGIRGWTEKVQKPQLVNQNATSQSSGYKPRFHKTTAFVATAGGPDDEADHPQGSSPYEDSDSHEVEPPPKEDEGLYIPSYLEEAIPDDPVLQVKVAHAL